MRTFTFGKALALALLLLAPWTVHAAGLGRLTVQSSLGQPLSAEIELVALRGDEASNLVVRLGSPEAYQQANLQYNSGLNGLKLSIERRANGQSYIKITGNRPIGEPFIDLLIELVGGGSRLLREYTALLDPPGYGQQAAQAAAPALVVAPESRPIVAAPVAPAPKVAAPVAAKSGAPEYGPIAKGETLGKIAASLKPEGVSLEQMLVGLYRSNPDAFIKKNLNLVKSGKILRVPDAAELAAITKSDAVKEYRTHVADWRAYAGKLADAAGQAPAGGSTARGRITARVEDTGGATGSKDVVKLSKGEPGKDGKPLTGAAKERAATEDKIASKQELTEARDRIAQLEKTVKNGQKLAELSSPGMTAAQQKAEAAKPAPAAKPDVKAAETAPPPAAEAKKDAAVPPPADKPVAEAQPAPKPKPKPVAPPPPPPPEPGIMDMVMDNLPIIGGGVGALVLGVLGVAALRRRRARAQDDEEPVAKMAPALGAGVAAAAVAETATVAPAADDVDPVAEAEVYIAYGRDGQAEDILKEAMGRDPSREDVQVKLAEVYAARKDAAAFGTVAESLHALTGGAGDNWNKVVALGYTVDPDNALYAAGRDAAPQVDTSSEHTGTDLDFDLGGDSAGTPDIALDAGQETEFGNTRQMAAAAEAGMPDFNLEAPAPGAQTDIVLEASPPEETSVMDFNIELPALDVPTRAAAPAAPAADAGLDFKIDVGDLNISLDEPATTAAPKATKDNHWYDVQQKFDLAKAYQEMGDNEGAREILQEVIKEGDAEQKDQAQKLLGSLG